jgi:PAS domain S-box-containing protein
MTSEAINVSVLEATSLAVSGPAVALSAWLLRRHRQPFFAEWVRGYAATFLLLALDYAHQRTGWEPLLLSTGVVGFLTSFFYLRTFDRIRGRTPTSPVPLLVVAAGVLALRLAGVVSLEFLVVTTVLVIAGLSCLLGYAMLQVARRENLASVWVAAPFFVKGLWVFAYPWFKLNQITPVGYWVDGLLHVAICVGMMAFVLERSVAQMSLVRDGTPGHAFVSIDAEGRVIDWNPGAERLFGFTADGVVGRTLTFLRPREGGLDDPPSKAWLQSMLRAEAGEFEVWLARADGRSLWCRTSSARAGSGLGQSQFVVMVHDITERRTTELRIRNLMTAIEQTPEGVLLADADGRVVYANPSLERIVGLRADELRGRLLYEVGRAQAAARTGDPMFDAVSERRPWLGRIAGTGRGGRETIEEAAVLPIRAGGAVTGFLVRRRDITEEVGLRERLRHAQKMEAFGRLAAGVAHDFGNLMTIVGAQNDLLMTPDLGAAGLAEVRRANERAIHRASMLIRQLLAYSRRSAGRPRFVELNAAMHDAVRMLGRIVGEELELVVQPEARRSAVRIDPGQLEQVLVNLVINARDAVQGCGRVILATSDAVDGGHVELSVTDDGPGMRPETLTRVFEPFFTTKETGTGLGLSIVREIVEEAGGTVAAESGVGRGTTLRIRLPACDGPSGAPETSAERALPRTRGTVLIVEDEEDLLLAIEANLVRMGFEVLTAGSMAQGLAVAGAHPGEIDLLLTDLTMPGGNGRTLAERLLAVRPEVRVLFMSGYSDDVAVREGRSALGEFIAKPFVFQELIGRIEAILDRSVLSADRRVVPPAG